MVLDDMSGLKQASFQPPSARSLAAAEQLNIRAFHFQQWLEQIESKKAEGLFTAGHILASSSRRELDGPF